jgi:chromosome segregation ATPase
MRKSTRELQTQIAKLHTRIADANCQIAKLQAQIAGVNCRRKLQAQIAKLQTQIAELIRLNSIRCIRTQPWRRSQPP